MNRLEISKAIRFLKKQVIKNGTHPDEILMRSTSFVPMMAKEVNISEKDATIMANIFIANRYMVHNSPFLKLTEIGYEFISSEDRSLPKLYLPEVLPLDNEKLSLEQLFYYLWDIIGTDKQQNPYYVDGKIFYDIIRIYCIGLPPTYSVYIEELKANKKSTSRNQWCKDLFVSIGREQINSFLSKLSIKINQNLVHPGNTVDDITEEIPDQFNQINNKLESGNMEKKNKIFISHNTLDHAYANAIVDLLVALGMNEEKDIFCSSVPGCGVEFGQDFIEEIRKVYQSYNLIILFIHSPRLYKSPISLNEMGAGWVLRYTHRSFLTADCQFDMLKGVIPQTETAFRAGDNSTYHLLNDFKDFIEFEFKLPSKGTSRWDKIKDEFIHKVESIKYDEI